MRAYRLAGLAILAVGAGCVSPLENLRERQDLHTPAGEFVVQYAQDDVGGDKLVSKSLAEVTPKLQRWGGLKEPVEVHVMPTHALLEEAVNKGGYSWLRAWAMYKDVFVQTPRTWSFFGATQAEVNETLLHELTHCVMYQQSATATTWRRKEIPLWFREGMATYTANQGYRWPTLEDLAQFYAAHPDEDPVGAPEQLYQSQSDIVYGAAHHAFTFLVRRYGLEPIRQVMANMSAGQLFPDAFQAAIGISPKSFVEDFEHYVRLRGFRGGRLRKHIGDEARAKDAVDSSIGTPSPGTDAPAPKAPAPDAPAAQSPQ